MTFPVSSADSDFDELVRKNVERLYERINACGRDVSSVRVVGVTKTFDARAVRAARKAGLTDVGENYLDELKEKRATCEDVAVRWHYMGALQSKKIARVANVADIIASVSRPKEVRALSALSKAPPIYVQVDYTQIAQRNGVAPENLADLVLEAKDSGLDVQGLMTVASTDVEQATASFRALRKAVDELGLAECSMGMSDDLEAALRAGSTEIRVGRSIFGPRLLYRGVSDVA